MFFTDLAIPELSAFMVASSDKQGIVKDKDEVIAYKFHHIRSLFRIP